MITFKQYIVKEDEETPAGEEPAGEEPAGEEQAAEE